MSGIFKGLGQLFTGLFGGPPKPKEPPTAPVASDRQRKMANERSLQRKYADAGRIGTALTDDSKLG